MTLPVVSSMALVTWPSTLVAHVVQPAVRSLLLGIGAAVFVAAFKLRSASLRVAIWKVVLCAALAMPFLGILLPSISLPVPLPPFRTALVSSPARPVTVGLAVDSHHAGNLVKANSQGGAGIKAAIAPASDTPLATPVSTPSWLGIVVELYLAVIFIFLMRLLAGVWLSRRLARAAISVTDKRTLQRLALRAYGCGLEDLPRLAESTAISVPLTLGILRPAILLPTNWKSWDLDTLDAVMAHELSHIVRRDALVERLSLLHRAFFWFSPLSWWIDRRLRELNEMVSDEAALSGGVNGPQYAALLVNFFASVETSGGRVRWQGISMANSARCQRRIERILAWREPVSRRTHNFLAFVVMIVAVPAVLAMAAIEPVPAHMHIFAQGPSEPAPPIAPVPPAPPSPHASAPVLSTPPVPAFLPSARPPAPLAPPEPQPQNSWATTVVNDENGTYVIDDHDDESYVITSGANSVTMSGSSEDAHHAQALRRKFGRDLIWFERDGKEYVITDEATVARAKQLFAPVEALGQKQAELGEQQAALGEQQGALGEKQSEVRVKVPDMSADLQRLQAKFKELSAGGTQSELGELQSEIGELQSRVGELQSQAGEEQSKIGEQQSELGRKQSELGRQQSEIGREQEKASKEAERQLRKLFDDALTRGIAKPE
jgi:beta-lactamase regulating signal transducer with metallopeptidase domain